MKSDLPSVGNNVGEGAWVLLGRHGSTYLDASLTKFKEPQKYLGICDLGPEQFILPNKLKTLSPKLQGNKHLMFYKEFSVNTCKYSQNTCEYSQNLVFPKSSCPIILNCNKN